MASRSSSASTDPFDQWRSWLDRAERQINTALNEAMASTQFGQVQGRLMEVLLGVQRSTNEAMGRYFETLNMPTRADVLSLAEKMALIEQRLGNIEHALASLGAPVATARTTARAKVRRTKKPPAKSEAPAETTPRKRASEKKAAGKKAGRKKASAKKTARKPAQKAATKKSPAKRAAKKKAATKKSTGAGRRR